MRVLGVRVLPLPDFYKEFIPGTKFYHGRVRDVTNEQADAAVHFALQHVGARYAVDFSEPSPLCITPWTQAYYCSSLVDHAYRKALGKDLVFTTEPFPLTFEPREFWEQYYREQGLALPSGFGSNATLLLRSSKVTYAPWSFSTPAEQKEEFHELF